MNNTTTKRPWEHSWTVIALVPNLFGSEWCDDFALVDARDLDAALAKARRVVAKICPSCWGAYQVRREDGKVAGGFVVDNTAR